MRGRIVLLLFVFLAVAVNARAFVVINEIHADPAGDLTGDASGDGIRSVSNDEFAELLNNGAQAVDISSWYLADSVSTRHVFPNNTILQPASFLAVFGGGVVQLPGINWQTASSGALSLNNTAETLTLYDLNSLLIDQVIYGALGNNDQSIVRFPEGQGTFVLHSTVSGANGALFSPGKDSDGASPAPATVPEGSTLAYLLCTIAIAVARARFLRSNV